MFSSLLLIVAISSTMILASPVPVAQSVGTIPFGFSFESLGDSSTIAAPNYNVPLPNNFLPSTESESLLAAADYTTPQPDNLLLTDYTIPQPDMLLLATTEDTRAVEICRNQGNCGLLGNPVPTSPDPSPPITPDLQWLLDKTSQPITTEFVNFKCGNTESVCCENWHKIPAAQSESQTASTQNVWLSCSNKQFVTSAGSSGTVPDLNFVCIRPKYHHDCDTLRQSLEAQAQSPDGVSRKCYSDCPAASAQLQFPVQWG